MEMYAQFYRNDDMEDAVDARSLLQLEAWPKSCDALATLPHLRMLRIHLANPMYLDEQYLKGERRYLDDSVIKFVRGINVKAKLEIYVDAESKVDGRIGQWRIRGIEQETVGKLEAQLEEKRINGSSLATLRGCFMAGLN